MMGIAIIILRFFMDLKLLILQMQSRKTGL